MPVPFPSTLPLPSAARLSQPDQRAKSRDGNVQVRRRITDEVLVYKLTYELSYAQLATFESWYVTDTLSGQRTISITLPGPGGFVERRMRFTSPPSVTAERYNSVDVEFEMESA